MAYTKVSSSAFFNETGVANMKVSEILQVKGEVLYTVAPDTPLVDAATTMVRAGSRLASIAAGTISHSP